jgi:hypothetical protein
MRVIFPVRALSSKVSLLGQHTDMLFGLENQGILQAVFRYPFRTLDWPTTDCSCNWCNMALPQHIVSMALVPCDHFLHVHVKYQVMLS